MKKPVTKDVFCATLWLLRVPSSSWNARPTFRGFSVSVNVDDARDVEVVAIEGFPTLSAVVGRVCPGLLPIAKLDASCGSRREEQAMVAVR